MIDTFKQDMLLRAINVSDGLQSHLVETFGIDNFTQLPTAELKKYHTIAIDFIVGELRSMGIMFIETTSPYTDAEMMETAISMREVFSRKYLLDAISSSDIMESMIQLTIENTTEFVETVVSTLIGKLSELHPLSSTWSRLNLVKYSLTSTVILLDHLEAILTKSKRVSTDADIAKANYIRLVSNHNKLFIQAIRSITNDVDSELIDACQKHDTDLTNIPVADSKMYFSNPSHPTIGILENDTEFIVRHKTTKDHHVEYFTARGITTPSDFQMKSIAADSIVGGESLDFSIDYLSNLFVDSGLTNGTKETILNYTRAGYNSQKYGDE